MAKTENIEQCGSPENALTKTSQSSENSNDGSESRSTGGECTLEKKSCAHLNAAVNFNRIRKAVQQNGGSLSQRCLTCKSSVEGDKEEIGSLILCMKCGDCCCADHVLRHYQTPRSDPHLVYVDINDWNIRCYDCDCSINADANGQLNQSILFLKNKKKAVKESPKQDTAPSNAVIKSAPSTTFTYRNNSTQASLAVMIATKPTSSLLPPRGLSNLGNTCFFNSVLQCLARTPFLVETLLEMREPGEQVVMKLEPHPPIEVELQEKWGPVTENLVSTLIQISTVTGSVYTPAHLLDALRIKHRQFMGFNQHDAHELLRTLLDCVKNEDLRRYRVELLRYLGLSRKTNPENVDEKKKLLAKEMDKKLTEIVNVRPDPVFRGFTVSANTCVTCSHKSEIPESFLDLSLPVCFFKLQPLPMSRRKNDFVSDKPSKHQSKKERKQARKNAKANKRLAVANAQKSRNVERRPSEIKDVNESGYSSDKASSPVQTAYNNIAHVGSNDEILAEALNEINNSMPIENSNEDTTDGNSLASHQELCSDVNRVDVPCVDVSNKVTPSKRFNNNDASTSSLSTAVEVVENEFAGCSGASLTTTALSPSPSPSNSSSSCPLIVSPLSDNQAKLSNNVGNGSSSSAGEDDDDDLDVEDEGENNDAGDSDEKEDCEDDDVLVAPGLGMTLRPPTSDDEENSILACLREYTKCEVLTGNNKVVCEKCTREANKNSSEKKQIYRNFTKQLLIKSPPPVLILHLKRFEARGAFSFRKVDTNISFPLTLDVGSFCSATCEKLLYPTQKNILYSLYGIVEHSGSLNAGHYVAYVKVRNTTKHTYRRRFLPKNLHDQSESLSDKDLEQMKIELQNEERQWYYISDSMVRPIGEEDVLRQQAYLLFYERIW